MLASKTLLFIISGSPDHDDYENNKKKRIYTEYADYHHQNSKGGRLGGKSPCPKDGQKILDNSLLIKENGFRKLETRVGIEGDHFVVFSEQESGKFHGHTRSWKELTDEIQKALRKNGIVKNKKVKM